MKPPLRGIILAAVAFCLGLLYGETGPSPGVRLLLCLTPIIAFIFLETIYRSRALPGVREFLLVLLWIALGWTRGAPSTVPSIPLARVWIEGQIEYPVDMYEDKLRVRLSDLSWRAASETGMLPGKALVYLPDTLTGISPGNRIRLAGIIDSFEQQRNPGEFSADVYWSMRGMHYRVRSPRAMSVIDRASPYRFTSVVHFLRLWIRGTITANLSERTAPLAISLLTGDRGLWSDDHRDRLADSGLLYLFAISGMHVGIILGIIWLVLPWFRLGLRPTLLIAIGMVWLYAVFVGANPPVVRASLGFTLLCGTIFLGRKKQFGYLLTVVFLFLLLLKPDSLYDVGFQLSFAGTAGCLYAAHHFRVLSTPENPIVPGWWYPVRQQLRKLLYIYIVSTAAWMSTLPFLIWHFGRIPWFGFLVGPLAMLILTIAIASGILALITITIPFLSSIFLAAFNQFLVLLDHLAGTSAQWALGLGSVHRYMSVSAVLLLLIAMLFVRRWKKAPVPTIVMSSATIAVLVLFTVLGMGSDDVKLCFLDVGQGDGVMIRRGTEAVIIDGGPEQSSALQNQLRLTGVRHIRLWILTHGDGDHVSVVDDIVEIVDIDAALIGPATTRDMAGEAAVSSLLDNNIPVYTGQAGTMIEIEGMGRFTVLSPMDNTDYLSTSDNNLSLVTLWEYEGHSVLFPGDAGVEVEYEIIQNHTLSPVNVLMAGHHGSRHSTGEVWLHTLAPEHIIFSCGRNNPYGHPSDVVLQGLSGMGTIIHRTDRDGAIVFCVSEDGIVPVSWNRWW